MSHLTTRDDSRKQDSKIDSIKPICINCKHVRGFKATKIERETYGYEKYGYGCRRRNWEGYTQAKSTCEAFKPARSERASQ